LKKRDYIPREIDNIICLSQEQSEKFKINSLEESRELPFGEAGIELKDVTTTGFTDADSTIITISSTFDETIDNLNEQSYLNETLRNTTTVIGDAVDSLRENVSNQIVELTFN